MSQCLWALRLFEDWPEKLNRGETRLDQLQQAFNTLITLKALGIILNVSPRSWRRSKTRCGVSSVPATRFAGRHLNLQELEGNSIGLSHAYAHL